VSGGSGSWVNGTYVGQDVGLGHVPYINPPMKELLGDHSTLQRAADVAVYKGTRGI
jgi:hypothetical protein